MMALDEGTLREIADSVCLPLLGTGAALVANGPADARAPGTHERLGARIEIDGTWQGTVRLVCSTALLDRLAGAMLDLPVDDVDAAAREETLLELANLFGGTVKGLLPGPSRLGLPCGATSGCGNTVALSVADEPLFVSVYGFETDGAG